VCCTDTPAAPGWIGHRGHASTIIHVHEPAAELRRYLLAGLRAHAAHEHVQEVAAQLGRVVVSAKPVCTHKPRLLLCVAAVWELHSVFPVALSGVVAAHVHGCRCLIHEVMSISQGVVCAVHAVQLWRKTLLLQARSIVSVT
jgi:hypothetical protein